MQIFEDIDARAACLAMVVYTEVRLRSLCVRGI